MANPQQPELRRSGHGSSAGENSAKDTAGHEGAGVADKLPDHLVPEHNRPGDHPEHDQDKPDLDAFAERLGLKDDD